MIPLYDDIRARRTPVVTYALIALNAAVYLYQTSLGDRVNDFIMKFGLIPWNMTKGIGVNGFSASAHAVPWLSHMFLHGSILHILSNMWFLHVFGDNVEDRLGRLRFCVLYFCGGLVAALMQVMTGPTEAIPMVGASGAVAAVLAGYAVFYPRVRVLAFVFIFLVPVPAVMFIGFWFLMQLFNGYTSLLWDSSGGVAWWAHIGGFGAGLLLAKVLDYDQVDPEMRQFRGGLRFPGQNRRGR